VKKICHVVDALMVGGLEKNLISIASNVKGYEHEIWCLRNKGPLASDAERAGIFVREFSFGGGLNLRDIKLLAREMRLSHFDAVHCHGLYPSVWGRIAAILAGVKVRIAHAQNVYYWLFFRDRVKLNILAHFTTKMIAVSEAVKKSLVGYNGISASKIVVINNSSPDAFKLFRRTKKEIRKELGFQDDDIVIACTGRLEGLKGHEFLIEAMALCLRAEPRVRCFIMGEGPLHDELAGKIRDLGLEGKVILAGLRQDVVELLRGADIFVLPSPIREGMPLVLAEASSVGLPLIATDVGGNPEVVSDSVNGFIVKPKDPAAIAEKVLYLAGRPDARRAMGEKARDAWSEKFSEEKMIEKVTALYGEMIR
jgi:glycosyltransferase involved in cell wall biosynthesis